MRQHWLKSLLNLAISQSLVFAPYTLLAPTPASAQQPTPAAQENLATRLNNLDLEIDNILDRTIYPNVPRLKLQGAPTAADITNFESKLYNVFSDLRSGFLTQVQSVASPELQSYLLQDLNTAYSIAQKFEALKIINGQGSEPESYATKYAMTFPLDDLYQLNFFTKLAFAGESNVKLGELLSPQKFPMLTALSMHDAQTTVQIRLNPDFIKNAEYQRFATQLSLRSALLFGTHFAAHGLYLAENATNYLVTDGNSQITDPAESWKNRFTSFKVVREALQRQRANMIFERQKPELLKAVKETLDQMQKANAGFSLNADFWKWLQNLRNAPTTEGLEALLKEIEKEETLSFVLAIESVLRIWDLDHVTTNISAALYFAKRLSLRFLMYSNERLIETLTPDLSKALDQELDSRAAIFVRELTARSTFQQGLKRTLEITPASIHAELKTQARVELTKMAEQIKDYQSRKVSLAYLFDSKRSQIDALAPSEPVKMVIRALEQSGHNYVVGYALYRQGLLTLLQAYKYPRTEKLTLKFLNDNKKQISFDPSLLTEAVPAAYIKALADDRAGRKKDLDDMLSLGKILKFDVYETLNLTPAKDVKDAKARAEALQPTLDQLEIKNGYVFGSDRTQYLNAIKKDLFTSAPVLGQNNLWQKLTAENVKPEETDRAIEVEIKIARAQALQNLVTLDQQTRKFESSTEDSLRSVGETLRTLVSRTSQLSLVLSSISGLDAYFGEMRKELLLPGFWERQWQEFNTWTNNANTVLLGFFAMNLASRYSVVAGRLFDAVRYVLTPLFGQNLARLTPMIWGLVGVNLIDGDARTGFEQQRLRILENFYNCNAINPCVALYSDVLKQEEIRNAQAIQTATLLAAPLLLLGGVVIASRLTNRITQGMSQKLLDQIDADMATLNIRPGSSLGTVALNNARAAAHSTVNSVQNPVARELTGIYIEQAYSRLQSLILKNARDFAKFDARLKPHADLLGITLADAKSPQSLANVMARLDQSYAQKKITALEYVDKKHSIYTLFQSYLPTWSRMDSHPQLFGFYEAAWNNSIPAGQARVMVRQFDKSLIDEFRLSMERFYGTETRSADSIVKKIIEEIESKPEISAARIAKLRRQIERSRK